MVTQYKPDAQAFHHSSKTQPKPRSQRPPPHLSGSTSSYCKLATELRARAPVHSAVVLAPWTAAPVHRDMVHVPWMLLGRQGAIAAFANAKTSPHLGLNIKYGIYPLSDGAS